MLQNVEPVTECYATVCNLAIATETTDLLQPKSGIADVVWLFPIRLAPEPYKVDKLGIVDSLACSSLCAALKVTLGQYWLFISLGLQDIRL